MTKQDKIKKVMDEFKRRTLKTPDGKVVKNHKQALAIAMSESEDYAEKGDLINQLSVNSTDEALDILKAAGTEDLFEKAKHQDGDMHPNGKWVWVASAAGGKGDWRTAGGRAHSKSQAGGSGTSTTSGSSTTPKQSKTPKAKPTKKPKSTAPKTDKERLDLQQEYATMSQLIKKPSTSAQRKKEFQDRMKEIEGMGLKVVKGKFQWSDTGTAATPKSKTKLTPSQQSEVNSLLKTLQKVGGDPSKITLTETNTGKWSVQYEGQSKKTLVSKDKISEATAKAAGMTVNSTSSSKPKQQKKLRPVGTGTNGPERRRKETKSTPKIPKGKRISTDDDLVEVYDNNGKKIYSGIFDDCPYKYYGIKWNQKDGNYDLPSGYKMVGK